MFPVWSVLPWLLIVALLLHVSIVHWSLRVQRVLSFLLLLVIRFAIAIVSFDLFLVLARVFLDLLTGRVQSYMFSTSCRYFSVLKLAVLHHSAKTDLMWEEMMIRTTPAVNVVVVPTPKHRLRSNVKKFYAKVHKQCSRKHLLQCQWSIVIITCIISGMIIFTCFIFLSPYVGTAVQVSKWCSIRRQQAVLMLQAVMEQLKIKSCKN